MESRIWTKSEEKRASILLLRGHEVSLLKVGGNMLTLKRNVGKVLEALEQGRAPEDAGAKSAETIDIRTITRADLDPGNTGLTLHVEGDSPKTLAFAADGDQSDAVLRAILEATGRAFRPTQEEIGVVEALIPPVVLGAIGGLLWMGVYLSAGQIAAGEQVEAGGTRRRGLQQLLIWAAQTLGTGGTIAVGVVLLALMLGWATLRIVKRPERTVWRPEDSSGEPDPGPGGSAEPA